MPSTTKPRILFIQRQDSAVGYYRTILPARALTRLGYPVTVETTPFHDLKPTPSAWLKQRVGSFDLLVTDRGGCFTEIIGDPQAESMGYRGAVHASPGARLICDFDDDFTCVPEWNTAWGSYQPGQERRVAGLAHLKLAELTTVSTATLVERFTSRTHAIRLAPNHIDPADWEPWPVNPARASDPRVRILYGGAAGHYGDLEAARPGIEEFLLHPPRPIRLIAFGAVPKWIHDIRRKRPDRVVVLPWSPFRWYPRMVRWGGFDVAIAPLADHPFNLTKSNIKWLECAAQGITFVASKIGPYSTIPSDCAFLTPNDADGWLDALYAAVTDAELRAAVNSAARTHVLTHFHADNLGPIWEEIVAATLARPRIETMEDTLLPAERVA